MTVRSNRQSTGQSLIETVVGVMFLIPIVLFLLDIAVLVIANTANDNLVKSACRAAASATDASQNPAIGTSTVGFAAALAVCTNFATPSVIIQPPGGGAKNGAKMLTGFYYFSPTGGAQTTGTWPGGTATPASGQVGCISTMLVTLPVPFPGFTKFTFNAMDIEPIVSIAP